MFFEIILDGRHYLVDIEKTVLSFQRKFLFYSRSLHLFPIKSVLNLSSLQTFLLIIQKLAANQRKIQNINNKCK